MYLYLASYTFGNSTLQTIAKNQPRSDTGLWGSESDLHSFSCNGWPSTASTL